MTKRTLLPTAYVLLPALALMSVMLGTPTATAGANLQAKPSTGWVEDASKAPLPTKKITGIVGGSAFTVTTAVWKKQMSLNFSDAPLEMMVLEINGTTKKPHGLGIPMDVDLSGLSPKDREEFLKMTKKVNPNALTFAVTIAVRKGASVAGKEFVHRPKESVGVPEGATPDKPVLVGTELRFSETDSVTIGYSMRLKFGPKRGSVQPGSIYLCLTDEKKSVLLGTFEAAVK